MKGEEFAMKKTLKAVIAMILVLALGFAVAAISELTLIALGVIGVSLALIYLGLKELAQSNEGGGGSGDPLGDILNDYE